MKNARVEGRLHRLLRAAIRRLLAVASCLAIAATLATEAAAQGGGVPEPGNGSGGSPPAQGGVPSTTATSDSTVVYFGSWVDDAAIVPAGRAWMGLSTGYWKAEGVRQIDAPVLSAIVGLNRRLQLGASASVYHFHDGSGPAESGMGSTWIYGKAMVVDPEGNRARVGLAVAPMIEISTASDDRLGWAVPVNLELRRDWARIYGSAGYFSRGSIFGSVALEVPAGRRVSITGTVGQSYATAGSHQTAVGLTAFLSVRSTAGLFVGLGHTFQPAAAGPRGLSVTAGASLLFPSRQRP